MAISCSFLFHGDLADFLPPAGKGQWIGYNAKTPASVKDAVEATGVPHVEIMRVEINGEEASLSQVLRANDRIEVFPFAQPEKDKFPNHFVLDVHLGKLARLLRMLGFDAVYQNKLDDRAIVFIAVSENRVVLTRDTGLLKHKVLQHGYWLRSQLPDEQLAEVMKRFSLWKAIQPFRRCLACNGLIEAVAKEVVTGQLLPLTKASFHQFYRCTSCQKIYWKGSHYERMLQKVEKIRLLAR